MGRGATAMLRIAFLLSAFISTANADSMAMDAAGDQKRIVRRHANVVRSETGAAGTPSELPEDMSESDLEDADEDDGPVEDCAMEKGDPTIWTPINEIATAEGAKRWCHDLSNTDKATCEKAYTFRVCEDSVGEPTNYLPCVWDDNGKPGNSVQPAKPERKCFAGTAYTCPQGMGSDLQGLNGRPDPCAGTAGDGTNPGVPGYTTASKKTTVDLVQETAKEEPTESKAEALVEQEETAHASSNIIRIKSRTESDEQWDTHPADTVAGDDDDDDDGAAGDCDIGHPEYDWKPVVDQPEARGSKRWCGALRFTTKETCLQSYTWRKCENTAGGPTQYLRCTWSETGKPGKVKKDGTTQEPRPDLKCFAHGAQICPAGIGGRQDPCAR